MTRVLLIDDDESFVDVISSSLNRREFTIIQALTASSGLDLAKTEKPDMILLDEILPDTPGNEVLRLLKAEPLTSHIPVAILSSYTNAKMQQDAVTNGAIDYILKYDITPHMLEEKIKLFLQRDNKQAAKTVG